MALTDHDVVDSNFTDWLWLFPVELGLTYSKVCLTTIIWHTIYTDTKFGSRFYTKIFFELCLLLSIRHKIFKQSNLFYPWLTLISFHITLCKPPQELEVGPRSGPFLLGPLKRASGYMAIR